MMDKDAHSDDSGMRKAGYLMKKRSTKWPRYYQRRWFVLQRNLLSWFKDSKSKTPLGYLKIDHIEWIDYHFNRPTELTFIALQPNKERSRLFILKSQTSEDCFQWRQILNAVTKSQTVRNMAADEELDFSQMDDGSRHSFDGNSSCENVSPTTSPAPRRRQSCEGQLTGARAPAGAHPSGLEVVSLTLTSSNPNSNKVARAGDRVTAALVTTLPVRQPTFEINHARGTVLQEDAPEQEELRCTWKATVDLPQDSEAITEGPMTVVVKEFRNACGTLEGSLEELCGPASEDFEPVCCLKGEPEVKSIRSKVKGRDPLRRQIAVPGETLVVTTSFNRPVTGVQLRIAGKLTDATPVEGTPPADSKADLKCKTTYATKWSGATELPGRHPGDRSAAVVPVEVLGGFRDAAGSEGAARTASEDSARSSHLAVWAPAAASFSLHELPWQWVCGLAIVLIGIVLTGLALPK